MQTSKNGSYRRTKKNLKNTRLLIPSIDDYKYQSFIDAVRDQNVISGLTHGFYRYPARFSPAFVRQTIKTFSKPGDLVFDPFMGGGTTIVEARSQGRRALGVDINSLARFVTKVKTTVLSDADINELNKWSRKVLHYMNLRNKTSPRSDAWLNYYRNIDCQETWPIRKSIDLAIDSTDNMSTERQKNFARCVILNAAQWALDCRTEIPPARKFREKIAEFYSGMIDGAIDFRRNLRRNDVTTRGQQKLKLLHRSTAGLERDPAIKQFKKPKLVVTSPPYPGIHVLYHRWQVQGRRETPAPYLITNQLDGSGASYYTFGDRHRSGLDNYFHNTYETFKSIASISDQQTLIVQMIAFSEPDSQLPRYLETIRKAGFREYFLEMELNSSTDRLWRSVPNRKWYADLNGTTPSSNEVVLFHKLK